ncbi:MAG TPA: carboxylesterase/lipase family protein [Steroidobacteraceae bacterium]|nr:carboxylesterase/lipase family protein [Steroidobacteraceae bacterium]
MDRRSLLMWLSSGAVAAAADVSLGQSQSGSAPGADGKGAGPVAQTRAGKVRGYMNGPVCVFKGIPYAASTAGANRFAPPRPREPWSGVLDATQLGDKCPQNPTPWLMMEEAVSLSNEPQSEDCLHLNVWTTGLRDGKKRPVMLWLHGGGYSSGSGGNTRYEGSRLATRQDVVVVTINHRLNIFGHLFLGDLGGNDVADSGNVGILDIVAALQWVRDNIAEFGGDPGNVTIFGESGGGGKVSTLLAMPAAQGLFHRAIIQSGTALRQATREAATKSAKAVLAQLGIQPGDIGKLRSVPQADLLAAINEMRPPPSFTPVVDGRSLPRHPFDPDAPQVSANVPLLVGSNETEVTFFPDTPLDPIDDATLRDRVKRYTRVDDGTASMVIDLYRHTRPKISNEHLYQIIASDYWMTSEVATQAERKAALGNAPVYVYYFQWESPVRGGKLRAVHSVEIPFVFDNVALAEPLVGNGPDLPALADAVSGAWTRFARTGNPNGKGLPMWPAYSSDKRHVMIFDKTSRVESDPRRQERLAIAAIKARQSA